MTLHLSWSRTGSGEGGPLMLLHGIGSTKADFTTVRPLLEEHFEVLAPDLPGHGSSPRLPGRVTVSRLADVLEADLDEMQMGRVHVLGNSLGGRLALELAARGRALSVVAISPSGLNVPIERIYQGSGMVLSRVVLRRLRRLIAPAARSPVGRTFLLGGLRGAPWRASEAEAAALKDGFAGAEGFWNMLWWALLVDVPTGLRRINVPVMLAQGTADFIASGQTPRYLPLVPGSSFIPLWGAGHAPQSDTPEIIALLVRRTAAAAGARGQGWS